MRIILLGAPGSGKGTQSQRLAQKHRIPQISTGDLLRAAVAAGSELGRAAKAAMDAGQLVSDDIVLGMIRERLVQPDAERGFILDGFPRNLAQASALDELLRQLRRPLQAVVLMEVDPAELVKRIAGRRTCRHCGRVFNVFTSPPPADGRCPATGAPHELFQRPDDKEETVAERLKVYAEKTQPLVDLYTRQGLLRTISAEGSVETVGARLEQALAHLQEPESTTSHRTAHAERPPANALRAPTLDGTERLAPAVRASREAVVPRHGRRGRVPRRAARKRAAVSGAWTRAAAAESRTGSQSTAGKRARAGSSSRGARPARATKASAARGRVAKSSTKRRTRRKPSRRSR
ncbi:MAG TPA: adenylate kinase [Steroidobacteraceae bacterium]|nr:adenylate kinase [Steroidobacteraceae bacterium]